MESEKVKEIKKALECCSVTCTDCPYDKGETTNPICINNLTKNALTLINELESEKDNLYNLNQNLISDKQVLMSENERLQEQNGASSCDLEYLNKKLENDKIEIDVYMYRIKELEKGIQALGFALEQGFNDCQTKTLKKFAERMKEKGQKSFIEIGGRKAMAKTVTFHDIDETLNEFLNKGE